MAESGKPKCGTCSTDPVVAATDPCATETECTPAVDPCEEDHTETICETKYATTVKVLNTFNFPAVGAQASLTLEGVTSLLPGSVLWNPTVGKLYVDSFDPTTGVAIVTNKGDSCDENAKTSGDSVPACTEFALGIPECNTGGSGADSSVFPHLAADFVAPAVDSCQLASVTTVVGIAVNDIVSLNTFLYRVKSIPDAETLELCNEGDGAPTGQVIEWDPNCDEVPDVQVISVSSDDPCSREGVNSGLVLVCDEGVQKPIVGTSDSQILVWDRALEKFVLKTVSLPESCTSLTTDLTVDVGDLGPYLAEVVSTAIFQPGDRVTIDDDVFNIDTIVNGTQMRLIPDVSPPAIKVYDASEIVCIVDCCTDLPERVKTIEETLADPCYPAQAEKVRVYNINSSKLDFYPIEGPPGTFQQFYDIGDPAMPLEFFRETFTLPPSPANDGCKYLVRAEARMYIASVATHVTAPTPAAVQDVRVFHDFVMGLNGDDADLNARGVFTARGSTRESEFLDGVPPAGFIMENYKWIDGATISFVREAVLEIGVDPDPEFFIGHRLALSDNNVLNNVTWGAGDGRIEWALDGYVCITAQRVLDS